MSITLRPYQELAVEAAAAAFSEALSISRGMGATATGGMQRALVVLSTGLGKTITALALAKRLGGPTLWLAHTDELVTQPYKAAQLVWPEVSRGIVKAELNQYPRHLVFASIQSAQQSQRRAQLAARGFRFVVVDEAHHALSPGYRALFNDLGCFTAGGPPLLGLTATPERSDQGALDEVFQGVVFQMGITSAIEGGYLCPPNVIERPIKVDLDMVSSRRGDFGMKELDLALMKAGIVGEITAAYEEHCTQRKTLIFVVSVEQAEQVAAALRARGHAAASVSGETPKEERQALLRKLKSGELRVLVNCMVLTEGFDEPSVDAVMLARPTQSKPLMIQMVGRGLRLFPGKSDCLVIDLAGVSKRNTLVQAAVIFGLTREEAEPEEKPRAIDLDPFTNPEEYWRQRLKSQIQGVKGAPRSKLRWIPAAETAGWLLPAGEYGTVRMIAAGEEWLVDVVGARNGGPAMQRLTETAVSMDTAQALAEDFIRRVNAVTLARKNSRWSEEPATEKQVALLTRFGIKNADQLSKQTAADLLTQNLAQRNAEPATPKQLAALRARGVAVTPNLTKREAMRLFSTVK